MRYLQHIHAAVLNQRQQRFGQVNAERGNGPICALSIPVQTCRLPINLFPTSLRDRLNPGTQEASF